MLFLLANGAKHDAARADTGRQPLHDACYYGNLDAARVLYDAGAVLSAADEEGLLPMHVACEGDELDVAQWLHAEGASLEALDGRGRTPLQAHARTRARVSSSGCRPSWAWIRPRCSAATQIRTLPTPKMAPTLWRRWTRPPSI